MAGVATDRDQADQEALRLELSSAARVAAPVRRAVAAVTTLLLVEAAKAQAASPDGRLSPQQQGTIRTMLGAALATLTVDIAAQTTKAVAAAVALALRQEALVLRELGLPGPDPAAVAARVLADPALGNADTDVAKVLRGAVDRIGQYGATAALDTDAQVQTLAARIGDAATSVEREVRSLTNQAINETTRQIVNYVAAPPINPAETPRTDLGDGESPAPAQPPANPRGPITPDGHVLVEQGLRVVWVAERNACLTCLRLSGTVIDPNSGTGFDEDATFGAPGSAPAVWPPGRPLMAPPRHPNCRCRLRIIAASNTLVPQALRREAERSVARGWSDHASRRSRLNAAERLLDRGSRLPKTVQERARRDVARGTFSTRHRPRAPHLRAD